MKPEPVGVKCLHKALLFVLLIHFLGFLPLPSQAGSENTYIVFTKLDPFLKILVAKNRTAIAQGDIPLDLSRFTDFIEVNKEPGQALTYILNFYHYYVYNEIH